MSFNLNKVMVAGNLTRDPEVRFVGTAEKSAVANFGLAINRKFKSGGETKEEVVFLDIEAWGKTAELVGQYLVKGRGCYIEGRLKFDTWDDKKDGTKRSKLKVVADVVQFIGGKGDDKSEAEPMAASAKAGARSIPKAPAIDPDEPAF